MATTTGSSTSTMISTSLPVVNVSPTKTTLSSTTGTGSTGTTGSSTSTIIPNIHHNHHNHNDMNRVLLLETMNEQLRTIVSKYITTLLQVHTRYHHIQELSQQQLQYIQSNIEYIQKNIIPALTFVIAVNTTGTGTGSGRSSSSSTGSSTASATGSTGSTNTNDVTSSTKHPVSLADPTTTNDESSSSSLNIHSAQLLLQHIQYHQLRRKTLLQQTSSLLELLELPNLMNVCIRSSESTTTALLSSVSSVSISSVSLEHTVTSDGTTTNEQQPPPPPTTTTTTPSTNYYYDEAIQIATFANALERRHGSSSTTTSSNIKNHTATTTTTSTTTNSHSIIHQVIDQIRIRQEELRQHLLLRLQSQSSAQYQYYHSTSKSSASSSATTNNMNNSSSSSSSSMMMNECLEIITALRRLNAIDLERRTTQQQQQQQNSDNTNNNHSNDNDNSNHHHHYNNTTTVFNIEQAHAMSEYQLQIAFLEARDIWLDSYTSKTTTTTTTHNTNIAASNSTTLWDGETVLDMIERYRTRMFEIATQYNAIFTTSASTTTTTTTTTTTSSSLRSSNSNINNIHTTTSAQQLLSLWITRRIQYFLQLLRQDLSTSMTTMTDGTSSTSTLGTIGVGLSKTGYSKIDTAMIRDAIEASVFFATSLGRLGGDFTSQLTYIFEPIVIQMITQQYWINDGIQPFHTTLEICRTAGIAAPLSTNIESTEDYYINNDDSSLNDNNSNNNLPPLDEPQPPPKRLLALPPLARFVNAILTGLNELRRCLLPGIFIPLRHFLKENVINVMIQELLTNERVVLTPGLRGEAIALRSIAVLMKDTFDTIVIPYILGSFESAIGYKEGAIQYHTQLYDNIKRLCTAEKVKDMNETDETDKAAVEPESTAEEKMEVDDGEDDTNQNNDQVLLVAATETETVDAQQEQLEPEVVVSATEN